ncbi:protein PIN-LIKES 5 [Sesamum angolense]|uniref:Protein PIN-LIKES 5 n=1 Tax=Sesamum angolense TaxID=2727404 RepID=A0AAE1XCV2_9LAMI|nr:protein PIN-LIKES 5 [Sesamum angolense]
MGFWTLLEISSMPILQVLIISVLGAFMATDYLKLLPPDARRSLNKIVFVAFTPSLIFASLAKTVRFQDIISWWFMPVNIGITFLVGGGLGWVAVKILRPQPHLQDLIIAVCATGNLGNILLIIIPAICKEDGNPFGEEAVCTRVGLSYVSFSMALGSFYIWTYTYHLIRSAASKYRTMLEDVEEALKEANNDLEANERTLLLNGEEHVTVSSNAGEDLSRKPPRNDQWKQSATVWNQILGNFHQIVEELKAPPVLAAGWNYSLHHSDTRRQPNTRAKQGKVEINDNHRSDLCEICDTSCSRDWHCETSITLRLSPLRSSLPLHPYASVHSSTGYEYRPRSYRMVDRLHVDLDLIGTVDVMI